MKSILITLFLFCACIPSVSALEHFVSPTPNAKDPCDIAGKVYINGEPAVDNEDEVAVFVSDDQGGELLVGAACVGTTVSGTYFMHVYAHEKDPNNPGNTPKNGAKVDEPLIFKVWDKSENKEYVISDVAMKTESFIGLEIMPVPPVWKESSPTYGLLNLSTDSPIQKKWGLKDVVHLMKIIAKNQ